jgi:hypothetical protein
VEAVQLNQTQAEIVELFAQHEELSAPVVKSRKRRSNVPHFRQPAGGGRRRPVTSWGEVAKLLRSREVNEIQELRR